MKTQKVAEKIVKLLGNKDNWITKPLVNTEDLPPAEYYDYWDGYWIPDDKMSVFSRVFNTIKSVFKSNTK